MTDSDPDRPTALSLAADGSLGDMLFFHSYKNPGLVLDIVQVGEDGWLGCSGMRARSWV